VSEVSINWTYEGEVVTEMPEGVFGFIYKLTYEDNTMYIGRKNMESVRTIPALKSGIVRDGATRVHKNVLIDEDGKIVVSKKDKKEARKRGLKAKRMPYDTLVSGSDWLTYEGSHDKPDSKLVKKEILTIALTKIQATYRELEHLVKNDVLFREDYLNKQINNLFYKGKI